MEMTTLERRRLAGVLGGFRGSINAGETPALPRLIGREEFDVEYA